MSQPSTYSGGCHCGQVRFEVRMDLAQPLIACNCSICGKTGTVLAFTPSSTFTLKQGEAALRDYQFGKKSIHHLFCTTCGIRSFARGTGPDGTEMAAVNVRCLDGVELEKLNVVQYNGRDR
jgi:hypothetical protein